MILIVLIKYASWIKQAEKQSETNSVANIWLNKSPNYYHTTYAITMCLELIKKAIYCSWFFFVNVVSKKLQSLGRRRVACKVDSQTPFFVHLFKQKPSWQLHTPMFSLKFACLWLFAMLQFAAVQQFISHRHSQLGLH